MDPLQLYPRNRTNEPESFLSPNTDNHIRTHFSLEARVNLNVILVVVDVVLFSILYISGYEHYIITLL